MKNSQPYLLLDLIRLLERTLQPADEAVLRERLGEDQQLRILFSKLQHILIEESSKPVFNDHQDFLTEREVDRLAAYLDRQLEPDAALEFEDALIKNQALLEELVSTERFFVRAHEADVPSAISSLFESLVAERIPQDRSESQLEQQLDSQSVKVHSIKVNGTSRHAQRAELQEQPRTPEMRSKPLNIRQQSRRATRQNLPSIKLLASACAAVVILVVLFLFNTKPDSRQPDFAENETKPVEDQERLNAPVVPKVKPLTVPPQEQNRIVDHQQTESVPVLEKHPEQAVVQDESPLPVPQMKEVFEEPRPIPLVWTRTTGLIVARTNDNALWQDVRYFSQSPIEESVQFVEFRSLPESWGEATFQDSRFVLGANSSVRVQLIQEKKPRITFNDLKGQLALISLPKGTELVYQATDQQSLLKVSQTETAIAFDANLSEREILVLDGAVSLLGRDVAAAHQFALNASDAPLPKPHRQRPRWITQPPELSTDALLVGKAMKQSSDVVSTLLDENSKFNPRQTQIATSWSFQLAPVQAVSMAAMSSNGVQRSAAVNWLLAANVDAQAKATVWKQISGQLPGSSLPVANWYLARQRRTPVTAQLLTELSQGLGANQPLFVRESSIQLLREITNQPFRTYDASRPTSKSIGAVRVTIRQLITRLNNARQRNNPQRRNGRGSS